jgi:hypothetical protein
MSIKYSGMMSYLIHSQATGEPPHLECGVEPPASACLMSHRVAPGGSPQTLYYINFAYSNSCGGDASKRLCVPCISTGTVYFDHEEQ